MQDVSWDDFLCNALQFCFSQSISHTSMDLYHHPSDRTTQLLYITLVSQFLSLLVQLEKLSDVKNCVVLRSVLRGHPIACVKFLVKPCLTSVWKRIFPLEYRCGVIRLYATQSLPWSLVEIPPCFVSNPDGRSFHLSDFEGSGCIEMLVSCSIRMMCSDSILHGNACLVVGNPTF
jgi:hypothetical protein